MGLVSLKYITKDFYFILSVILSSVCVQIYPQLLVSKLSTYMCGGSLSSDGLSALVPHKSSQGKCNGKYVTSMNSSPVISSLHSRCVQTSEQSGNKLRFCVLFAKP